MIPMKQAIDKTVKQNLLGRGGGSSPLSLAVAKTQVQKNRLQTEMKEKSERTSVQDI